MRPPKGKRDWRVEFEDSTGVYQIGYPPDLEKCRNLIRITQEDPESSQGVLRARIYFRKSLQETHPFNPAP